MSYALSFEEIAIAVARILVKEGGGQAEIATQRFERNVGWDRHKLLKRAQEIAKQEAFGG